MHVITDIELFLKCSPSLLKIDIQKVVKRIQKSRNTDLINTANIWREMWKELSQHLQNKWYYQLPPTHTHTQSSIFWSEGHCFVFSLKKNDSGKYRIRWGTYNDICVHSLPSFWRYNRLAVNHRRFIHHEQWRNLAQISLRSSSERCNFFSIK